MRIRDLVGTALIAAVAVPYAGDLINGEMPFIKDPRGMSATGLVLGVAAFLVLRRGDAFDNAGKAETGLALLSLALGIVALALAETAAAEVLLAVFIGSILVVWAIELLDHVGIIPATRPDHSIRDASVRLRTRGAGVLDRIPRPSLPGGPVRGWPLRSCLALR